jgi:hypothetical protein
MDREVFAGGFCACLVYPVIDQRREVESVAGALGKGVGAS